MLPTSFNVVRHAPWGIGMMMLLAAETLDQGSGSSSGLTSTWEVILLVAIGPAVTAAFVTVIGTRIANRQVEKYKDELGRQTAREQLLFELHVDSLKEQDEYILEQQTALASAYRIIFEGSPIAEGVELLDRLRRADETLMEPFRRNHHHLSSANSKRIYAVHNFIAAGRIDDKPPDPSAIHELRGLKNYFFELVNQTRHALEDDRPNFPTFELEVRES